MTSMKAFAAAALCALAASHASAQSCQDNFKDDGSDPRNGITYMTSVTARGLDARTALGQVARRGIDQGYSVGLPVFAGTSHRGLPQDKSVSQLLLSQSAKPPLPLAVTFDARTSALTIGVSLAPSQGAPREGVRDALCKLVGDLDAGPKGRADAESAWQQAGLGKPIAVQANDLSQQLKGKLADARPGERIRVTTANSAKQRVLDDAAISAALTPRMLEYLGRTYEIDGQVGFLNNNTKQQVIPLPTSQLSYSFEFLVWRMKGLGGIGGKEEMPFGRFQVTCYLADKDKPRFATMREQDFVHMRGIVTELTPSSITLSQCTQVGKE